MVMPGLAPGIHDFFCGAEVVDGRDKPGHDEEPGLRLNFPWHFRLLPVCFASG